MHFFPSCCTFEHLMRWTESQWVKTSSLGREESKPRRWSISYSTLTCKLWAAASLIIVYQASLSNLSEAPSVHLPVILLLLYYCTPTTLATLHWYFLTWRKLFTVIQGLKKKCSRQVSPQPWTWTSEVFTHKTSWWLRSWNAIKF